MKSLLKVAQVAVLVLCATAARADQASLRKARQHAQRAKVHYELGEYQQAAQEYATVYRIKPVPALLYNIAQSWRRAGQLEKARELYQAYLRQSPDPKMRGVVEAAIREIAGSIAAKENARASHPPLELAKASPDRGATVQPVPAGAAPSLAASPIARGPQQVAPATALELPLPEAAERTPVYKKWWFWAAAGAVAVGAGAAFAAGSGGHGAPATHFGNTPVF
jgi:tetratricopeptide (TPR) repeat protein